MVDDTVVTIAVGLAVDILDGKQEGEFVTLNNGDIDGFEVGLVDDNTNNDGDKDGNNVGDSSDGSLDGMELWIDVSNVVGIEDCKMDGVDDDWEYDGDDDGFDVGSEVGDTDGEDDGVDIGSEVGDVDGDDDGMTLNNEVGTVLGNIDNDKDGFKLGCGERIPSVGLKVGMLDSRSLGLDVGDATR